MPAAGTVRDERARVWLVTGALGAMAIGIVLIVVRDRTSASNLAFVFLLWTIVVAEVGGRVAAMVTAVVSALSLNFFLTKPYLTLSIDNRDDIIAFVAMAVSGLVAAAFGRRRHASAEKLSDVRSSLEIVDRVSDLLERDGQLDDRLTSALRVVREFFHLRGVVLRTEDGRPRAAADPDGLRHLTTVPLDLEPDSLLVSDASRYRFGTRGLRLPAEGGRLVLRSRGEVVGSLDLWEGDQAGFDHEQYQALSVITRLVSAELARAGQSRNRAG
jgi:K+-sensing histidine kinase KdpD